MGYDILFFVNLPFAGLILVTIPTHSQASPFLEPLMARLTARAQIALQFLLGARAWQEGVRGCPAQPYGSCSSFLPLSSAETFARTTTPSSSAPSFSS